MPRVLLIAWDGADWRILDPLLEQGALPNLQALLDRGQRDVLKSTIPTHSWAAWPSFLTGVNPADHGVYDILETVPGTHKQYPVTYKSIKERTFVSHLSAAGKEGVYVDVPLMFPPPDVRGKVLAGGVLPVQGAINGLLRGDIGAPFVVGAVSFAGATLAMLAVLLEEPEKQAVVEATMGSVLCAPSSLRWEVGNAATAGVKRRRLTPERARQLVTDFEHVTIRELAVDLRRAVDLGLELGISAYEAYILEAARSSGFPLLALDGPVQRNAKRLGLSMVELDL